MPNIQTSIRVKQELANWLKALPYLPKTETDCIETMKIVERLVYTGYIDVDINVAHRLQAILFFIPSGSYREIYWPKIWIKASRLLSEIGFIHKLQEVACSQQIHYLSAAGALALAKNGFMEGSVKDWLASTRDYYLLTDNESQELKQILPRLDDAERLLAQLKT